MGNGYGEELDLFVCRTSAETPFLGEARAVEIARDAERSSNVGLVPLPSKAGRDEAGWSALKARKPPRG
ncbi:hypothetical protein FHT78_000520 [Rhizobium sp. BK196]|uniref:hypothetical protein n=1 Tax=Rhizobium sp. BK196 TaxID=2587073 RepID=UPI0018328B2C|nr:hypothetical protein [Rhizobium sp. BK196]MBB3308791.1 hypothetical protein [Rhizobium sp. BK196]